MGVQELQASIECGDPRGPWGVHVWWWLVPSHLWVQGPKLFVCAGVSLGIRGHGDLRGVWVRGPEPLVVLVTWAEPTSGDVSLPWMRAAEAYVGTRLPELLVDVGASTFCCGAALHTRWGCSWSSGPGSCHPDFPL